MTYLDLVNRVLRGLRENTVAGITADYPRLIGQLVNEAKADLEDDGPWSALRQTSSLTFVAGDNTVIVSGSNDRSYLLLDSYGQAQMFVEGLSSPYRLIQISHEDMRAMRIINPNATPGIPIYFSLPRDQDGLTVSIFPVPDVTYTIRGDFIVPQDDLDDVNDELFIPSEPVWREALVRAMEERGEEFAGQLDTARTRASDVRAKAIMRDFGALPLTFEAE